MKGKLDLTLLLLLLAGLVAIMLASCSAGTPSAKTASAQSDSSSVQPAAPNSGAKAEDGGRQDVSQTEPEAKTNATHTGETFDTSHLTGSASAAGAGTQPGSEKQFGSEKKPGSGKSGASQDPSAASTDSGSKVGNAPSTSGSRQAARTAKPAGEAGTESGSAAKDEVLLSITGDDQHGVILPATTMEFHEGDTVLDILQRETRAKRIQMESRGSGAFAYIEGIDNLYEMDRGAESGWMFKVNGVVATRSAGVVKVAKGDRIEWVYTLNLGKDVGSGS